MPEVTSSAILFVMAELEIHHEEGHAPDPFGQRVGVLAAVLAVALAVVTIASHRAHTAAVVAKAEENDQWSYYQSKKLKQHSLELETDLLTLLGPKNADVEKALARYESEKRRYESEAGHIQEVAREKQQETAHHEARALRFDLGEGMIEIGLVLSSLYFISRKKLFPVIGVIAGMLGSVLGVWGTLL